MSLTARRADRVEPTPETAAKLKPNPLASLDPELQIAADGLREAWVTLTSPVSPGRQIFEKVAHGGNALRTWNLTPKEWALLELYRAWYTEMARRGLPTRPVVAIVVDGDGLSRYRPEIEPNLIALLKVSLRIFARLTAAANRG